MITGQQALRSIEQAAFTLRGQETQIDGALRSADEEVARLRADRTGLLRQLAQVRLDTLMIELAEQYPDFGWEGNKGYGSSGHLEALERCGATTLHRRSWNIPGVTPEN